MIRIVGKLVNIKHHITLHPLHVFVLLLPFLKPPHQRGALIFARK
jgi:hypothetical protein